MQSAPTGLQIDAVQWRRVMIFLGLTLITLPFGAFSNKLLVVRTLSCASLRHSLHIGFLFRSIRSWRRQKAMLIWKVDGVDVYGWWHRYGRLIILIRMVYDLDVDGWCYRYGWLIILIWRVNDVGHTDIESWIHCVLIWRADYIDMERWLYQ